MVEFIISFHDELMSLDELKKFMQDVKTFDITWLAPGTTQDDIVESKWALVGRIKDASMLSEIEKHNFVKKIIRC